MTCQEFTPFCSHCAKWVIERRRHYGDGAEQTYYTAPDGKGHCEVLDLDTGPHFGCNEFDYVLGMPGDRPEAHIKIEHIEGAPWERWTMIPCPDCNGVGSANDRACRRCSGTAKVRRYDDGYVADQTWDHPLEKERKKAQKQPPDPALQGTVLRPLGGAKEGAMS